MFYCQQILSLPHIPSPFLLSPRERWEDFLSFFSGKSVAVADTKQELHAKEREKISCYCLTWQNWGDISLAATRKGETFTAAFYGRHVCAGLHSESLKFCIHYHISPQTASPPPPVLCTVRSFYLSPIMHGAKMKKKKEKRAE